MSTLESMLKLLEKWPTWKRMREAPDQVDALTERVQKLEKRLERAHGQACPSCGALEFRVIKSETLLGAFGKMGARDHTLRCGECGFEDQRRITPT